MSVQRKRYNADLKTRVALEAIKGQKTAKEIAAEYGVHPTQIAQRKKQALDGLPEVFSPQAGRREKSEEALIASLYQQIGQLKRQCGKYITFPGNMSNSECNQREFGISPAGGQSLSRTHIIYAPIS